LLERAASGSPAEAADAWKELLSRYLPALAAHLVHAHRIPHDQVDDILQGFVVEKILSGHLFAGARAERGRFRSYILTALERYLVSCQRREQAACRSPGPGALVPLDSVSLERSCGKPLAYDLAWIREVLQETLRRVERACRANGRDAHWEIFSARVVNPALHGAAAEPYDKLALRLGIASPVQAANMLVTAKRMFERAFREVISEYAGAAAEVDDEIREIFAILSEAATAAGNPYEPR
jgi:RNA polymerase sigma-70 factor (ECF subfamily)